MPLHQVRFRIISGLVFGVFLVTHYPWSFISIAAASFPELSIADPALTQTPDIIWEPEPFIPVSGVNARYIDFDNGNDSNEGSTRANPWKHHPWDPNATGVAAATHGARTYFFKKGVTYRGYLVARESGDPENPIHLTVAPDWGTGDAVLAGSVGISGGWRRCVANESAVLPAVSRLVTWCREIDNVTRPGALWEVRGSQITPIPMARTPNWRITVPQDPRYEWGELEDAMPLVEIGLSSTDGFKVNERLWLVSEGGVGRSAGAGFQKNDYRVIEVGEKSLRVEVLKNARGELKKGKKITNGTVTGVIDRLVSSHETLWRLVDRSNMVFSSVSDPEGVTIWVERSTMPKPVAAIVDAYDREKGSMITNLHVSAASGPVKGSRYYLEGAASFLDSPGEYYFADGQGDAGRMYLRLPDDRDPNRSQIEVARAPVILEIRDQSYIRVSGLVFRFTNQIRPGTRAARHAALHASSIQIRGNVSDIRIHHSRFEHLTAGIVAYPVSAGRPAHLDYLDIADNVFADISGEAVALGNGRDRAVFRDAGARLIHVAVSRNRLERVGLSPMGHGGLGSHGHGINIHGAEVVDVVGNYVNFVGGSGISVFIGSGYEYGKVRRPYLRSLIHENKVTNSLLRVQDYGGIESWNGGPTFLYNNISGNPVGYKHRKSQSGRKAAVYRRGSYGVGIYLDGQYKGYAFNNIVWGYNNDVRDRYYNAAAFNEANGFMNTIFNNTFFNFAVGLHKGMYQHNRCSYIGNLLIDMGYSFIQQVPAREAIDYKTIAFRANVFSGDARNFGRLGHGKESVSPTLGKWAGRLKEQSVLESETGVYTVKKTVRDKRALDFYPAPDSVVIDAGKKVFVPWPLYRVVGEWHFLRSGSNPEIVRGENINMNEEWFARSMFQDIPRNDLACVGTKADNYQYGILEDWIEGALRFSGRNNHCFIRHSELSKGYAWKGIRSGKSGYIRGQQRDTVDMATNNFLIEAVVKIQPEEAEMPVVSKIDKRGYELDIDEEGRIRLSLLFGTNSVSRSSSKPLNDGDWHHILAVVNRENPEGISLYIDGQLADGQWSGKMDSSTSLSNAGDFNVGRSGERYYTGSIDFLRISKGTLEDAETTIDELYTWEFDGPFLRDFSGKPVSGAARDVGAVEFQGGPD